MSATTKRAVTLGHPPDAGDFYVVRAFDVVGPFQHYAAAVRVAGDGGWLTQRQAMSREQLAAAKAPEREGTK